MRKCNILVTCIIVICFSLGAGVAKAQGPEYFPSESQQSTAGAATVQAVTPLISNPVAADPGFSAIPAPPPPPPGAPPAAPPKVAGTAEVGFQTIYSTHIQVYRIPLSYAFTDNLKMELNVPYVRKKLKGEYTNEDLSAKGLGDISLGAKYRYGDAGKIQWMTSFYLKLPTGEEKQFEGRREQLALGTGSYDFIINQTVTGFFGNVMVIGNVGYAFNTKSDYTETNNWDRNVKYENQAGNVFNYLVGAEYYTPVRKLVAYVNVAGLIMGRSHIKETNEPSWSFFDRDEDKKDRLKTMDFIAGVKYMLTEKINLRLGFVAPVLTDFDPDANDTQDRDWLVDFGFAGRF